MLFKRLAVGGMAELFLAQDTTTDAMVVIKRILPYLSGEAEFVQMFLDEARIAAQLHHKNIIQVHELGKLEDSIFISMEYVEGVDLRKVLQEEQKRQQTVPYHIAAYVTAKVCAGLQYAHNRVGLDGKAMELVHRDVSPQNVMVGFDAQVKLVDFGIAKAGALMERSKPGVIKGKFLYLSPEQLAQERIDHRADLFSLGTMLYEITTGKSPFFKPTTEAVIYAIRAEEPPPPTLVRDDYPLALARVVGKCMVKDRDRRYQQARDIQADLEAFLLDYRPTDSAVLASYVAQLFGISDEPTRLHVTGSDLLAATSPRAVESSFSVSLSDAGKPEVTRSEGNRALLRAQSLSPIKAQPPSPSEEDEVDDLHTLTARKEDIAKAFEGGFLPRPPSWGRTTDPSSPDLAPSSEVSNSTSIPTANDEDVMTVGGLTPSTIPDLAARKRLEKLLVAHASSGAGLAAAPSQGHNARSKGRPNDESELVTAGGIENGGSDPSGLSPITDAGVSSRSHRASLEAEGGSGRGGVEDPGGEELEGDGASEAEGRYAREDEGEDAREDDGQGEDERGELDDGEDASASVDWNDDGESSEGAGSGRRWLWVAGAAVVGVALLFGLWTAVRRAGEAARGDLDVGRTGGQAVRVQDAGAQTGAAGGLAVGPDDEADAGASTDATSTLWTDAGSAAGDGPVAVHGADAGTTEHVAAPKRTHPVVFKGPAGAVVASAAKPNRTLKVNATLELPVGNQRFVVRCPPPRKGKKKPPPVRLTVDVGSSEKKPQVVRVCRAK